MKVKIALCFFLLLLAMTCTVTAYTTESYTCTMGAQYTARSSFYSTANHLTATSSSMDDVYRIEYVPTNDDSDMVFVSDTYPDYCTVGIRSRNYPALTGTMKIEAKKITITFDTPWFATANTHTIQFESDSYAGGDRVYWDVVNKASWYDATKLAMNFCWSGTSWTPISGYFTFYHGGYPPDYICDITSDYDYKFVPADILFTDNSEGFPASPPYATYNIDFDDGYYASGNLVRPGIQEWEHTFESPGEYNVTYNISYSGVTYYDNIIINAVGEEGCPYDVSLTLSKHANIMPLTEYITASASITGDVELMSGSSIHYMYRGVGQASSNPVTVVQYQNVSSQWWRYTTDLGIYTMEECDYADILSAQMRFPASGDYQIRVAVMPISSCTKYDDDYVNVNPTSGVNLWVYYRDGISFELIQDDVTSAVEIFNKTGNVTYSGNPLSIACNIGDTVSIWAGAYGYETGHLNYTIPSSVYGTTHTIPFYLFPEDIDEYYPGNTTWIIDVKNANTGDDVYGALVSASDITGTIDSGSTDYNGRVVLYIPYRDRPIRLTTYAFPYIGQTRMYNLGNATTYNTVVYLEYSGTPTPTPTSNWTPIPTWTPTPTPTETPIPTVTTIERPNLIVDVYDAEIGISYPIQSANVRFYDGDEVDTTYKGALILSTITGSNGRTSSIQMDANRAYWVEVSKSGYYTMTERFRMSSQDATIFVPLQQMGSGVTVITTMPTYVIPTPSGTGITGGFIGYILELVQEWFGVDETTGRLFLGLFITMLCAVFVGGSLAGMGSGEGAGVGAIAGGCFGWAIVCILQLVPFWLLPVSVVLVLFAYFVWRSGGKE